MNETMPNTTIETPDWLREMETILREEVGATPSSESRALMEQLRSSPSAAKVGD